MSLTVEAWGESDTEQFVEWFHFDSHLHVEVGLPSSPTRGDLEGYLAKLAVMEINDLGMLRAVRDGEELVGYVTINPRYGVVGMCHIIVAPWKRGRGVEIAKAAIAHAKEDGRLKSLVAIPSGMPEKVQSRFLTRCGFTTTVLGQMEL